MAVRIVGAGSYCRVTILVVFYDMFRVYVYTRTVFSHMPRIGFDTDWNETHAAWRHNFNRYVVNQIDSLTTWFYDDF